MVKLLLNEKDFDFVDSYMKKHNLKEGYGYKIKLCAIIEEYKQFMNN